MKSRGEMKRLLFLMILFCSTTIATSEAQKTPIEHFLSEALIIHVEHRTKVNEAPGVLRDNSVMVLIDKSFSVTELELDHDKLLENEISFVIEGDVEEKVLANEDPLEVSVITPLELTEKGFQFRILDFIAKEEQDEVLFMSTDYSVFELYYDCDSNLYRLTTIFQGGN